MVIGWRFGPPCIQHTSRNVASLRAGLTMMIYWAGCRGLHASETQQLDDATPICYLCGIARAQPSTNDGPTCNTP